MELSEQKFASAFQSNSAMMSISTFEEGKYIDVNKAFCEIMAYSRHEIIGSTNELLGIYIDPDSRQNIISRIKQDIQVHDEEVLMQTKTGEIKTCLVSTDFIYIGEERCTLSVTIDITARKIAEEELKKARREAEKANMVKSEFLSRMSHELRTPMNSIMGFAQLMEMSELNPSHRKRVNHILNNGKHLLKLINEMLDISGIEAGKLNLIYEPLQLTGIINEVIDAIQVIANKKNVTLKLIDSPSNNLFIQADMHRVKQVLLNLITNAIKYNKESGFVKISTELISTEISGSSKLRISIHDSGIGIKAENISKLFQPFERIGADKSEIEGTGLGLAIVMKLTKAMGGTVGVESDLGVGSTFWIELPQNTNPPSVIRNKEVAVKQNALPEDTVFSTVLYIEDNTLNFALVKEILAEYKPSVQLETSMYGKQALSLAKRHKPDLILLDLDLLDIKGSEVLEKLLADPNTKSIPVIIVSADAMSYQIENLKKAGATDYLTKPIDVIQFLKIINQYCKI
jgi:PAS domain S-box-containing protein